MSAGHSSLFLGIRTFRAKLKYPKHHVHSSGLIGSYLSTVFLTLTNPLSVFAFIAVFAALGLGNGLGYLSASFLVTGVFLGSALWFMLLISVVKIFKKKLDIAGLRWVNRVAGILILISSAIVIASLF